MRWSHSTMKATAKLACSIDVLLIISAALYVLLMLKSGEAMATVKAGDFFTGNYLLFANAIDQENTIKMRELASHIDLNKRVGEREMTVFVYAVAAKRIDAMKELVRLGADPTLVVSGVGAPLSLAASADDPILIETLLKAGCNPNAVINNEPILFNAQLQDRPKVIEVMLKNGSDINITDSLGNNVLKYAIGTMHYDMAIFLITKGADVHAKTHDGLSIAYSTERARSRMVPNSPGAKKLEKIIEMMKERGVKFPADPPPKKR